MSYSLCGLRVVSDFALPSLLPWAGSERAPDIEIRRGAVPVSIGSSPRTIVDVAASGACRLALPGIATFLVENGRRVTVDTAIDPEAPDVQVFLLGSVFGYLCHQRGLLPLHAGCVEIGGRAIAFAGESGMGKSTLVWACLQAGLPMLADDVTVIQPDAPGGPLVLPSFPRVKLWRAALDGFGLPETGFTRIRPGLAKYLLPAGRDFRSEPLPLAALYHLDETNDPARAGITPLRGKQAVAAMIDAVYRRRAALGMGRQPALLEAALRLGTIPQARLTRVRDLALLPATVATLIARHRG